MANTTTDPVSKKMNSEERTFQKETLTKYRSQNIIPSLEYMRMKTATSMNTCVAFMHGNTTNNKVMAYIRIVLEKNLRPIPADVKELFAIWDRINSV